MALLTIDNESTTHHPLDLLEEVVGANEWAFERASRDELAVEIEGRWCGYRLYFFWQEDMGALHFSSIFETKVPKARRQEVHNLLALINEKLWLGHFDLSSDDGTPMFRHTVPLRGAPGVSVEQFEDLFDVATTECERFYPAFQFVIWGGKSADDAMAAAILDVEGEA
ncbi:MAG: hypothetical protein HOL85_22010 [Rhodospirillaceae bacterium]|nr:hypothetical protein [Rhodospirillaceae bacterium]